MIDPAKDPWVNPPHHLCIVVPFIPPTSNKIYVTNWRQKTRFLSKEAKAFKTKFSEEVVAKYLPWLSQMEDAASNPDVRYSVEAWLFLDRWSIENKGWFSEKRTAKTRYKKMDTGNRLKLLNDCVSNALGVDDSHFFDVVGRKRIAQNFNVDPQVRIYITKI